VRYFEVLSPVFDYPADVFEFGTRYEPTRDWWSGEAKNVREAKALAVRAWRAEARRHSWITETRDSCPFSGLVAIEHEPSEEWVGYPMIVCDVCHVPWPCPIAGGRDEPIEIPA
jgi:hypothetical protein